jgi:integrase
MLRLSLAFGLRRHEVIECMPWKIDFGDKLAAHKTKGGRPRNIYIDTPEQRRVLDYVKRLVGKNERLGWTVMDNGSAASVEYALKKWYRMLAKIGITKKDALVSSHGLRMQYAENAALIASLIPPTLGGTGGQMPPDDLDLKRLQVSELLGHSRKSITSAYYGTFGRNNTPDSAHRTKHAIAAAVPAIPVDRIREISAERMDDCIRLTVELMKASAYVEPRIAQALWEYHSSRHATDWLAPSANNIAALEAAANYFARRV